MPIKHITKADNGTTIGYHVATRLQVDLIMNVARVTVASYADEQSALAGLPMAWQFGDGHGIEVPVDLLAGDQPTFLAEVENALVSVKSSPFYGGDVVISATESLADIKVRKTQEITAARLKADAGHFTYSYTDSNGDVVEKDIRTGDKDMVDLLTTNSYITLFGDFDEDWPGGWKAIDNTYVVISTVDQWKDFFKCMYKTGITNFKKSQQLKAQIEAATTAEEVASINWNSL